MTVFSGKVELGQGIETAIAQIAAEELDVPLERIELVAGDTTRSPNEWYTAGSQSVEVGGSSMRIACAEVRRLFLDAAARQFEVGASALRVTNGTIEVPGTDLSTSYWELAARVDLARDVTGTVPPKPAAEYSHVGTSVARRDLRAKLTGAALCARHGAARNGPWPDLPAAVVHRAAPGASTRRRCAHCPASSA